MLVQIQLRTLRLSIAAALNAGRNSCSFPGYDNMRRRTVAL